MISKITKTQKEYMPWQAKYGVTKFIDPATGDGHRGIILKLDEDTALLYGLTGEYTDKLIEVKETNPEQWPEFVKEVK